MPVRGKITIGSADEAHVRIPGLPMHAAELELKPRETLLVPNHNHFRSIEVNGVTLNSRRSVPLKHNYVLTFYSQDRRAVNDRKFFRFVYYNRFLDPQA